MNRLKIGFIPTHREFFDEEWAIEMRNRTVAKLEDIKGVDIVVPDGDLTKGGIVRNPEDSKKVIKLF